MAGGLHKDGADALLGADEVPQLGSDGHELSCELVTQRVSQLAAQASGNLVFYKL